MIKNIRLLLCLVFLCQSQNMFSKDTYLRIGNALGINATKARMDIAGINQFEVDSKWYPSIDVKMIVEHNMHNRWVLGTSVNYAQKFIDNNLKNSTTEIQFKNRFYSIGLSPYILYKPIPKLRVFTGLTLDYMLSSRQTTVFTQQVSYTTKLSAYNITTLFHLVPFLGIRYEINRRWSVALQAERYITGFFKNNNANNQYTRPANSMVLSILWWH